jgi:hypothetical protein
MNDSSETAPVLDLEHLSRRTGLIVRLVDAHLLAILFDRLAEYDAKERAETFDYLKHALDEMRSALNAEPVFKAGRASIDARMWPAQNHEQ